jgi:hypothetical protein
VKLAYSPQPVPTAVAALRAAGAKIVKVALGHNHCVAVDAEGKVYTWGNGGYGRLGHKEQKDEWLPKQVRFGFAYRVAYRVAYRDGFTRAGGHPGRRPQPLPGRRGGGRGAPPLRSDAAALSLPCHACANFNVRARSCQRRAPPRPLCPRRRGRCTTGARRAA